MKRSVGLGLLLALVTVSGLALGQDDPFADDGDPFEGEDPFAEYEQQAANTSEATEAVAAEDDSGDDSSEDQQPSSNDTSTDASQTKDSPGPGLLVTVSAGAGLALVLGRRRQPS